MVSGWVIEVVFIVDVLYDVTDASRYVADEGRSSTVRDSDKERIYRGTGLSASYTFREALQ